MTFLKAFPKSTTTGHKEEGHAKVPQIALVATILAVSWSLHNCLKLSELNRAEGVQLTSPPSKQSQTRYLSRPPCPAVCVTAETAAARASEQRAEQRTERMQNLHLSE